MEILNEKPEGMEVTHRIEVAIVSNNAGLAELIAKMVSSTINKIMEDEDVAENIPTGACINVKVGAAHTRHPLQLVDEGLKRLQGINHIKIGAN